MGVLSQPLNAAMMFGNRHIFHFLVTLAILLVTAVSCSSRETVPVSSLPYLLVITTRAVSLADNQFNTYIYDRSSGLLDSFQSTGALKTEIASTSGSKTLVVTSGLPDSTINYRYLLSLNNFSELLSDFRLEDPEHPVMTGMKDFEAGPGKTEEITMKPTMARIRITRFKTDFSSRPYAGESLKNARAYLINASSSCPVLPSVQSMPTEFINQGELKNADMARMKHPEMLLSSKVAGATFYCYPNNAADEGPGVCTTRLVIEGSIAGVTYYWPVNIGDGIIERGHTYDYDITITRTGMLDPDTTAENCMGYSLLVMDKWTEKDDETVYY